MKLLAKDRLHAARNNFSNLPDALQKPTADALLDYIDNNSKENVQDVWRSLIEAYGNDKPLTLYRGLHFDNQQECDDFVCDVQDNGYLDSQISSWSTDPKVARKYCDKTSYGCIVILDVLELNTCVDFRKAKCNKEKEVLLPPGCYDAKIYE